MHRYDRAYHAVKYRGILKTKAEWAKELNQFMEGDK